MIRCSRDILCVTVLKVEEEGGGRGGGGCWGEGLILLFSCFFQKQFDHGLWLQEWQRFLEQVL